MELFNWNRNLYLISLFYNPAIQQGLWDFFICLFRGNVIFDLLLANGYRAKNRFITSYFNGKYFIELHVTNITQKDVQIIKYLEKYYFDDLQILSNGILSKKDINSIITTHSIISKKDNLETQNT